MPSSSSPSFGKLIFLVLAINLFLLSSKASAFGAGNIPSVSSVEGKNFRHGDIEDTLAMIAMSSGGFMSSLTGGKKFNGMSIKRVYFGNWLRDYSQAVDVGTLSKGVKLEAIRVLVWVLSFLAFGYATGEYEVTTDRLGVYRPEEHIDNPKDYADNKDARQYDSRLRGPVSDVELEIDPQTGMKNYIANERGGWDTSTMFIRSSLEKSIHFGRLYRSNGNDADHYESLRLLGQALHCLEDFSAHSNYIELTLQELGNRNVFAHVGSQTTINLHGKRVFPLVTGTFGSLDFLHSLLGEAQDHLSQTEVEDLDQSLQNGRDSNDSSHTLKKLLSKVPISIPKASLSRDAIASSSYDVTSGSRSVNSSYGDGYSQNYSNEPEVTTDIGSEIDRLTADSQMSASNAGNMSIEEIVKKIYPFLAFRDRIMKAIDVSLEKIPFLDSLIEKISDTLTIFVMGLIAPFVTPLINGLVKQLQTGSQTAVDNKDQEEVWNVPTSHNPTHSYLSKDHFSLYLNEPAGLVAKEVLACVVPLVVSAWEDTNVNTDQLIGQVLEVFHHPVNARSEIQMRMRQVVQTWLNNLGGQRSTVINSLSSNGVRSGANHIGGKAPGGGGHSHGYDSKASKKKPHNQQHGPQKPHKQQHAQQHQFQKPSDFISGAVNSAAQAAGVSQFVNSSGVHMPSQIPSIVPGADYLNNIAHIGKMSKKFGFREGDENYVSTSQMYTSENTGDQYYRYDESVTMPAGNGYIQQDQFTVASSSGENSSYYTSSESTYTSRNKIDPTHADYSSFSRYDDLPNISQDLPSNFENLRIGNQSSTFAQPTSTRRDNPYRNPQESGYSAYNQGTESSYGGNADAENSYSGVIDYSATPSYTPNEYDSYGGRSQQPPSGQYPGAPEDHGGFPGGPYNGPDSDYPPPPMPPPHGHYYEGSRGNGGYY